MTYFFILIGQIVSVVAGLFGAALMLALGVVSINYVGQRFWNKLLALYDRHTLWAHLQRLESEGKLLRRTGEAEQGE
nr:hypothetical protein [uncultured Pseudomonas sp.]